MNSPRWTPPRTPWRSAAIHGAVIVVWLALFANAFLARGISGWSVGIVYIAYDTILLAFTAWQTWPLRRPPVVSGAVVVPHRPSLGVIVAAYNEAAVLEATVAGLLGQSDPPDAIVIADDGSTDGTAAVMHAVYGLAVPVPGAISAPSVVVPQVRWLRLPHGGKAVALNASLLCLETDLVLTVDADTILERDAIGAMRAAFATTPGLVAATGVLTPVCDASVSGRVFEWFQTYEYVRNFLSRYAWMRQDSLLLISGAFAGFRRDAVALVGGFDPDCLVEDYELIHRLRRYGFIHGLGWHSAVIGAARGRTSAPGTLPAFLRQRRRWFGGFLQTQYWYRDMVGAAQYRHLGTWMLPVKAIDTMQPVYGLCAFALLLWYIGTGRIAMLIPVGGFIFGKIVIDLGFHGWSVHLYRNWVGGRTRAKPGLAILAAIIEPFSFQLFRHLGATWGWVYFLTGKRVWGVQKRVVARAGRSDAA